MRYLKVSGIWFMGCLGPVLLSPLAMAVGWEPLAKVVIATLAGYTVLLITGGVMKLVMDATLDQIGGWCFGLNLVVLSIGDVDLHFVIGSTLGILIGWYMISRSIAVWQNHDI